MHRVQVGASLCWAIFSGGPLLAQEHVDWTAAAECFVQKAEQPGATCTPRGPSLLGLLDSRRSDATRQRALDELERLATSSRVPIVRLRAMSLIASAGSATKSRPIDTMARMERLYWSSSLDREQQALIVRNAHYHVNQEAAARFLGRVAQTTQIDNEGDIILVADALNRLPVMGEAGRAVLLELNREESLEPYVRRHLARLEANDWRPLGNGEAPNRK